MRPQSDNYKSNNCNIDLVERRARRKRNGNCLVKSVPASVVFYLVTNQIFILSKQPFLISISTNNISIYTHFFFLTNKFPRTFPTFTTFPTFSLSPVQHFQYVNFQHFTMSPVQRCQDWRAAFASCKDN